jgi:hypothetical protein
MRVRPAFTLFELILAIALSATLLALIGTAVNLYLVRMDTGRTRVEEAQLARSILSTIAADVRATTVYQTQDTSSVAQLAMASAAFDPDSINEAGVFAGSALGQPGTTGSTGTTGTANILSGAAASSSSASGLSSDGTQSSTTTTSPGLNGLGSELLLDVARLPRLDELFPTVPQQSSSTTNTSVAATQQRPSDLKSVRYFIRQGTAIDPSDPAATMLSPEAQLGVGGLVRQTIDRAIRQMAEQAGNSQLLNSGQVLLAPEVTQIQFIYFDGTTAVDSWDMQERTAMPTAIDVRIWLAPDAVEAQSSEVPLAARMYSQTIELPLAQAAGASVSSSSQSSDEEDESEEEPTLGQQTP